MGQKNFGRIIEGFFLQENVWRFLPGGEKKWPYYRGGRIAEVAMKRGFTVDSY